MNIYEKTGRTNWVGIFGVLPASDRPVKKYRNIKTCCLLIAVCVSVRQIPVFVTSFRTGKKLKKGLISANTIVSYSGLSNLIQSLANNQTQG